MSPTSTGAVKEGDTMAKKEEDIREGGNLRCPYCGKKYENKEFVDADMLLKLALNMYVYCESWRCRKCKKQVWFGTDLIDVKARNKGEWKT